MTDNFHIDVIAPGRAALDAAIAVVFQVHRAATHYAVLNTPKEDDEEGRLSDRPGSTLVLYWSDPRDVKGASPLAFPLTLDNASDFVWQWLRGPGQESASPEPDHDGSNGHGWRVFNEAWGHVYGSHYAVCGVQHAWMMYGK